MTPSFFVFVVKLVANYSSREVLVTQVTWTNKHGPKTHVT